MAGGEVPLVGRQRGYFALFSYSCGIWTVAMTYWHTMRKEGRQNG
jgi:hypothetical protein